MDHHVVEIAQVVEHIGVLIWRLWVWITLSPTRFFILSNKCATWTIINYKAEETIFMFPVMRLTHGKKTPTQERFCELLAKIDSSHVFLKIITFCFINVLQCDDWKSYTLFSWKNIFPTVQLRQLSKSCRKQEYFFPQSKAKIFYKSNILNSSSLWMVSVLEIKNKWGQLLCCSV